MLWNSFCPGPDSYAVLPGRQNSKTAAGERQYERKGPGTIDLPDHVMPQLSTRPHALIATAGEMAHRSAAQTIFNSEQ